MTEDLKLAAIEAAKRYQLARDRHQMLGATNTPTDSTAKAQLQVDWDLAEHELMQARNAYDQAIKALKK